MSQERPSNGPGRRRFLKVALAGLLGAVEALVPASLGVYFFCDPLRRQASAGALVRVASLEALPADGLPRKFTVMARQEDAWNKYPNAPVGAVYLRRLGSGKLTALNVVCPHAGCIVDFNSDRRQYRCPCHQSSFTLDGAIADPSSPSPRGLDELEVELRNGTEIWVRFRNFMAAVKEKVPV